MTTTTPTTALADYTDPTIACSDCGLTMGESRLLGHLKLGSIALAAPSPQVADIAELPVAGWARKRDDGTGFGNWLFQTKDGAEKHGAHGDGYNVVALVERDAIAASRRAAGGEDEPTKEMLAAGWGCMPSEEEKRSDMDYVYYIYKAMRRAALATPAPASAGQAAPAQPEPCLLQEILDGLTPAEKAESERIRAELRAMPIEDVASMVRGPIYLAAQPAEGAAPIEQFASDLAARQVELPADFANALANMPYEEEPAEGAGQAGQVTVPEQVRNYLMGQDLYLFLTNAQNGIDSPATMQSANRLLVRLDKLRELIAAQPAKDAGQAGQVAKGPDQQQIEWGNDLQGRLIHLSQDMTESEDARQVMAEAACLLASLTGHAVSQ